MTAGIIMGNIRAMHLVSLVIDPASVAANTTAEQTFTLNGAATYHLPVVMKPTATAGLGIVGARISAANTLAITFSNNTASPIDAGSETYVIFLVSPESGVASTKIGS